MTEKIFNDNDIINSILFDCQCCLFLLDMTNKDSLTNLKKLVNDNSFEELSYLKIILVENKIDEEKEINEEEVDEFMKENNLKEKMKISIKNGTGIEDLSNKIKEYVNDNTNDIPINFSTQNINEFKGGENEKDSLKWVKTANIIFLGNSMVGKSSLFLRIDKNHFKECFMSSIGMDRIAKSFKYKKDIYILAIESSCDETSVSIVKNGTEDVATIINSQIDIHKNYGGVVPEIASRKHMENITIVLDECLSKANMKFEDMDAFACTYAPGLTGSLLVGLECAKTLSLIYNKPFIKVNHMLGHISANKINNTLKYPLISLIVSGGHTDLILMKDENNSEYLGSTLDDAIGECYDKVAKILGLSYPGGPNVERLALNGKDTYKMPTILNDESYNFSFSGIKSHVNNLVHNEHQRGNEVNIEDLCRSFQDAVTKHLIEKTKKALLDYNIKYLLIAGGVASNTHIREELLKMCKSINVEMHVPDKKYCTDNATMIGAAAYPLYLKGEFATLDTNAKSNENIK